MNSVTNSFFLYLPYHSGGYFYTFGNTRAFGCLGQFIDDILRDENTRNIFIHVPGHFCSDDRHYPCQDLDFPISLAHKFHKSLEFIKLVNCLCLNETHPRFKLLSNLDELGFNGISGGSSRCPDTKAGASIKIIPHHILTRVQGMNKVDKLYRVKIKHRFCLFVVTNIYGIASKTENVGYPPRPGKKDVCLNRQPVSIPARHLKYWLPTALLD